MLREQYRRRLPHRHLPGATLFLTMRLANSLPVGLLARLQQEYQGALGAGRRQAENEEEAAQAVLAAQRRFFADYDRGLDHPWAGSPRWLADAAVRDAVLRSLHWLDRRGDFALLAVCLMSDHAHLVVRVPNEPTRAFDESLRDFKQFTALAANRLLGRTGAFWQSETFDRVVRDSGDGRGLQRVLDYVRYNPVKAGLCATWDAWPGTWYKYA